MSGETERKRERGRVRDNHTAREGEGENGGGLVIPSAAAGGSLFFLVLQLAERGGGIMYSCIA